MWVCFAFVSFENIKNINEGLARMWRYIRGNCEDNAGVVAQIRLIFRTSYPILP